MLNPSIFFLTGIYFHYYFIRLIAFNEPEVVASTVISCLPSSQFSFFCFHCSTILKHQLFIIFCCQEFMNLLKNFGGATSSNAVGGGTKPLGSKNNYFSTLKLQQDEPNPKEKSKDNRKSEKKKGPPKDFIPNKFALSFDPPSIIFEYKNPENNKLYHHKMKLKKLKKETNTKDALDFLRKRHNQYFSPKIIDEGQVEKLIQKLKMGLTENRESQMQDVEEEQDFDFDYDDDFEDL